MQITKLSMAYAETIFPPSKDPIEVRSNIPIEKDKSVNATCLRILVAHAFEEGAISATLKTNKTKEDFASQYDHRKENFKKLMATSFEDGYVWASKYCFNKSETKIEVVHWKNNPDKWNNYSFIVADKFDNELYRDMEVFDNYDDALTKGQNIRGNGNEEYFIV